MPAGVSVYAVYNKNDYNKSHHKEAYVTVLHSSEAYVCGAIALAQSIHQINSTRDLVLLADDLIGLKSTSALLVFSTPEVLVIIE